MSRSIAVVSPFLDKQHGTERCICEQIEHLAQTYGYEIHIYSRQVEDVAGVQVYSPGNTREPGTIWWHQVPPLPGPYVLGYSWWFIANHLYRWWDAHMSGLLFDMVYTPGINCLDADVISVHIIFAEFHHRVKQELQLHRNPVSVWHRLIHNWVYRRMIMTLEQRIYTNDKIIFAPVSCKTAHDQTVFYGETPFLYVVYHGIHSLHLNVEKRLRLRNVSRSELHIPNHACAVLLIGNAWKKKGLHTLLRALGQLNNPNIWLLIAGRDERAPFEPLIQQYNLTNRIRFLPIRSDVEFYYAAADIYAGPSLEDAFALPPAEAMACGVPTIVSSQAGASEIVTHGEDAFILQDPTNAEELAGYLQRLYEDPELRQRMGERAAQTASQYTWERNAAKMHMIFQQAMLRKRKNQQHARQK